jgi:hypothetical protein
VRENGSAVSAAVETALPVTSAGRHATNVLGASRLTFLAPAAHRLS